MQWVIVAAMLMIGAAVSLTVGVRAIEPHAYMEALWHYDPFDPAHVTIVHIRFPRFLAAIVVGTAMGIAGLVMHALSLNTLADPGILGENAGAAFALVLGGAHRRLCFGGRIEGRCRSRSPDPGGGRSERVSFVIGDGSCSCSTRNL